MSKDKDKPKNKKKAEAKKSAAKKEKPVKPKAPKLEAKPKAPKLEPNKKPEVAETTDALQKTDTETALDSKATPSTGDVKDSPQSKAKKAKAETSSTDAAKESKPKKKPVDKEKPKTAKTEKKTVKAKRKPGQPRAAEPQPVEREQAELHPNILISGYYGFDNLGDELILKVLVDELKRDHNEVVVLSHNPAKTAKDYGVRAIHRNNVIDIIDALASAHLFISGGGGLFQDATGAGSAIYYGGLIHLARYFEVPVVFWGQGVGPLRGGLPRKLTASALRQCEFIAVRDQKSADLVNELIDFQPEITADPVWMLKPSEKVRKDDSVLNIGISLRPWPDLNDRRLAAFADVLRAFAAQNEVKDDGKKVKFLLLPFQKSEDNHLLESLAAHLRPQPAKGKQPERAGYECELVEPGHVLSRIPECDLMFGMRFHSLILGLLNDVPVYGLIYDPKVDSLITDLGLRGTPINQLEKLTTEDIAGHFAAYPAIDLAHLKEESRRNFEILGEFTHLPQAELVI